MTPEDLEALGRVVLMNDYDPVPWEDAPAWRQRVCKEVAKTAVEAGSSLSRADMARSTWTRVMVEMGWAWAREVDEATKKHPGIVFGELTTGGVKHWNKVCDQVCSAARLRGLRVTGD